MRNVITAVILFLALAGCSVSADNEVTSDGVAYTTVVAKGYSMYVTEITLSDGTQCAVAQGYYKGGITCDWGRDE